MRTNGST